MLRPLDPIVWTREVLVARAKRVLRRDDPLTLRKALRVLARYGRRRMQHAVDKWKSRRLHNVMERVTGRIKHVFTWWYLRLRVKAIQHAIGWLQDKTVQIERIDEGRKTHRIVTTHLAQPVTVEIAYTNGYKLMDVFVYPLKDVTHIRLLDLNQQPIEMPQIHPTFCLFRLDSTRGGSMQTKGGMTINEHDRIGLATVAKPHNLLVILRTLLKLGSEQGRNTPC